MQNTTKNTVFEQILCVFEPKKHIFGRKQNIRLVSEKMEKIRAVKIGTHFAYIFSGLIFAGRMQMEIQDKNSILQQMLGARLFNVSAAQPSENIFADMLNSGKPEKAVSFEDAKNNIGVSVKDKKEVERPEISAKENKKEKVQPKKNSADNKPEEKVKDKTPAEVSEDNAVAAAPAQAESEPVANQTQGEAKAPAEESAEPVEGVLTGAADVAEPVSAGLTVEIPVLAPAETAAAPAVNAAAPAVTETFVPSDSVEVMASAENAAQPVAEENTAGQPVVSEEDALLFQQAEYIDKKVSSDSKIKIEVAVQEEKIAASSGDDVIQNRFEVDALLRKMNGDEKVLPQEISGKTTEKPVVAAEQNTIPATPMDSVDDMQSKLNVAAPQTTEEKAQVSIEASRLSASGKEMVVEASSSMRSEPFARINETSSRDVFKGMGKEVVEQIKVNITKSAVKGVDTIDIQLKPEDLGKIQIKMHISKDGRLQAEIISGRQETLDMLQKEISGLAKAFEDAGYETDGKSFSFSFQDDNQAGRQSEDDSGLLKFIGDALEQEADGTAGNDNVIYNPALGLNIRV